MGFRGHFVRGFGPKLLANFVRSNDALLRLFAFDSSYSGITKLLCKNNNNHQDKMTYAWTVESVDLLLIKFAQLRRTVS